MGFREAQKREHFRIKYNVYVLNKGGTYFVCFADFVSFVPVSMIQLVHRWHSNQVTWSLLQSQQSQVFNIHDVKTEASSTKTLDAINPSLFVRAVEEDGDEGVGGAAVGHDLVREEDLVDAVLVADEQRLL